MQWMVAPESTTDLKPRRRLDDLERGRLDLLSTFMLGVESLSIWRVCEGLHAMSERLVTMHDAIKIDWKSGDLIKLVIIY